ncbi:MAG: NUDIX hydrolase [Chloroflexi bacterium]|nr:NUDIX hydrolase [Chloroflexota bacterium]
MRDEPTDQAQDERPRVSVDVVLFTLAGRARAGQPGLQALLVRRDRPPFAGCWSLPGRLIEAGESLEAAAQQVIHDRAAAEGIYLEQLYTFGEPGRDPRGRVITVAYYALVRADQVHVPAASDRASVAWFPADAPPPLAFDHGHILAYARARLRNKIEYTDMAFQFLPDRFTLTHLRQVYEAVLDEPIDKRNFNRKVLGSGLLVETGRQQAGQAHRPAMLYSFVRHSPDGVAGFGQRAPGASETPTDAATAVVRKEGG